MAEVAFYRAALPIAELNNIGFASFTLLYTPLAARLFAKLDYRGISGLYWQTAAWMSVLSFPVFAVTFSLAKPVTIFFSEHVTHHPVSYCPAFPRYLFQCYRRLQSANAEGVRKIALCHCGKRGDGGANLVVSAVLIKLYGTLGAAIGSTSTMIGYNLLCKRV